MDSSQEASIDEVLKLRDSGDLPDSLLTCLKFLSAAPEDPQGRLLLANLYYLLGCVELASEEVRELFKKYPEKGSLKKLLGALDPTYSESEDSTPSKKGEDHEEEQESVLAETDFEFDDLDLIEE